MGKLREGEGRDLINFVCEFFFFFFLNESGKDLRG